MEAIIEFDQTLKITRVNPAAKKLFKSTSENLLELYLTHIFAQNELKKIKMLIQTLEKQSKDKRNLYIPGGLTAIITADGRPCPTEGTLSTYEFGNDTYFTLMLRNEKERIEAQQKIHTMSVEAHYLREEVKIIGNYDQIIGNSEPLLEVLRNIEQVSRTDATVLLYGETCTGKEAIARAIHASSHRCSKPLITVNCAAIPMHLIESEFFGHEKGSFTGASARRHGRFALADKGTIFWDEIGELPVDMQGKLLRVLQEGEFEPIGTAKSIKVDTRVISATNRNLHDEIKKGNFREDLYYRLNVFPITLPPLRERGEDVIALASFFIRKFSQRMGRPIMPLSQSDHDILKAYPWPGNVRELQNVIERAVNIARNGKIDLRGIVPIAPQNEKTGIRSHAETALPFNRVFTDKDLKEIERDNIIFALETAGWRISGKKSAARLLSVRPSTFASRMKKHGVVRP